MIKTLNNSDSKTKRKIKELSNKVNEMKQEVTDNTTGFDLIKSEYENATKQNTDIEIVSARLGKENLKENLLNFKKQLNDVAINLEESKTISKTITDASLVHLEGCAGGNVEIKKIEGNTQVIDGKLVSSKVRKIKTLSSNLIDSSKLKEGQRLDDGSYSNTGSYFFTEELMRVLPNRYYFSNQRPYRIYYLDSNKVWLRRRYDTSQTIQIPSDTTYIQIQYRNDAVLEDMMLSLGNSRNDYIPHSKNSETIDVKLSKVGNIADTLVGNVVILRNREVTLTGSENIGILVSSSPSSDIAILKIGNKSKDYKQSSVKIEGKLNLLRGKEWLPGGWYNNPDNIVFTLKKGTTLQEAKTQLTGTKILYNLKEEYFETITLDNYNPTLTCYEEGYLQVESENVSPTIKVAYAGNRGGQIDSNSTAISLLQKENNVLWNAMYILNEEIKKLGGKIE